MNVRVIIAAIAIACIVGCSKGSGSKDTKDTKNTKARLYRDNASLIQSSEDGPWIWLCDAKNREKAADGLHSRDQKKLDELAKKGTIVGAVMCADCPSIQIWVGKPMSDDEKKGKTWDKTAKTLLHAPTGKLVIGGWDLTGEESVAELTVEPGYYKVHIDRVVITLDDDVEETSASADAYAPVEGVIALEPLPGRPKKAFGRIFGIQ